VVGDERPTMRPRPGDARQLCGLLHQGMGNAANCGAQAQSAARPNPR
jgi:hypothetical protein